LAEPIALLLHQKRTASDVDDVSVSLRVLLADGVRFLRRNESDPGLGGRSLQAFQRALSEIQLCSFLCREAERGGYRFYPRPFEDYFVATALHRCFDLGVLELRPLPTPDRFRISEGVRRFVSESLFAQRLGQKEANRFQPVKVGEEWVKFPEGLFVCNRLLADGGVAEFVEYGGAFLMARRPVTKGEYKHYLEANPGARQPEGWSTTRYDQLCPEDDFPVIGIRAEDAEDYCRWLGEQRNEEIQLPSDAQWQRAARGREGRLYHWDLAAPTEPAKVCNGYPYWQTRPRVAGPRTTPCGEFGETEYLCDLIGNVWEWTSEKDSRARLLRGASYYSTPDQWILSRRMEPPEESGCRRVVPADSGSIRPEDFEEYGFRLVREPDV